MTQLSVGANGQKPLIVGPVTSTTARSVVATDESTDAWAKAQPNWKEIVLGAAAMIAWVGFFAVGFTIPTLSMRDSIVATVERHAHGPTAAWSPAQWLAAVARDVADSGNREKTPLAGPIRDDLHALEFVGFVVLTVGAFTFSNLFFLCLAAAFLGCMARRWSTPFESVIDQSQQLRPGEQWAIREVRRAYVTAVLRGFLAYLVVIAGYLLLVPDGAIGQLSPGQYSRMAGAVSAFALLVGYEPRMFTSLFKAIPKADDATPKRSTTAEVTKFAASVLPSPEGTPAAALRDQRRRGTDGRFSIGESPERAAAAGYPGSDVEGQPVCDDAAASPESVTGEPAPSARP